MIETDADRRALIASLDGGTYRTSRGYVFGMFEDDYAAAEGASVDIDSSLPRLHLVQSDVVRLGLQPRDSVLVGNRAYRIATIQGGMDGMSVALLEEQS